MKRFFSKASLLGLFAFIVTSITYPSSVNADPVTFLDSSNASVTPSGDDVAYKLSGISLNFDGTTYTDVYVSLNNVLSFGVGTTVYADFPASDIPSVSMNADDWTVDFYGGAQADEYLTADLTGNVLTITNAAIPYGSGAGNTVTPTVSVLTVTGVGGAATFSYTVNGSAGTDYSLSAPRTAVRTANGSLIPLSQYNGRWTPGSVLTATSQPKLSQKLDEISCTSGSYSYMNAGVTSQNSSVQAAVYELVIDGNVVSRLIGGNSALIPLGTLSTLTNQLSGTASLASATWALAGKKDFSAYCQVKVWQGSVSGTAVSSQIDDSAKLAAIAAKAQAWEDQRAAATAANFTKEAREARKRAAARGGN